MKTCKTCAYWSDQAPFGQPNRFVHRMCECHKLDEDVYEDSPTDTLRYSYREGGCFYSGPDFGCIHWVTREVP